MPSVCVPVNHRKHPGSPSTQRTCPAPSSTRRSREGRPAPGSLRRRRHPSGVKTSPPDSRVASRVDPRGFGGWFGVRGMSLFQNGRLESRRLHPTQHPSSVEPLRSLAHSVGSRQEAAPTSPRRQPAPPRRASGIEAQARRASVLIVRGRGGAGSWVAMSGLPSRLEIPDGDVGLTVRRLQDDLGRKGSIALLKIHPARTPKRRKPPCAGHASGRSGTALPVDDRVEDRDVSSLVRGWLNPSGLIPEPMRAHARANPRSGAPARRLLESIAPMAVGFSPKDASLRSFRWDHQGWMVVPKSRRGVSMCPLGHDHQAAWVQASRPRGPPNACLAGTMSPDECPQERHN